MSLIFDKIIAEALDVAIERRIPFVVYVKPESDEVHFFADNGADAVESTRRFIVKPWCGREADEFAIQDCVDAAGLLDFVKRGETGEPLAIKPWQLTTEKSKYIERVDELIDKLSTHGGKTVISRTIAEQERVSWVDVAQAYFDIHPEAMRYMYYTPLHGFWLGASPELLLKTADGRYTTMALAGSRDVNQADEAWSGKNIAEQAIVRNYIVDVLYDLGLSVEVGPTETVTTGNLQHLRTMISGSMADCRATEIIDALNPTPALAGYPLQSALENIVETEGHPRRCYGGYVALETADSTEAYVNLRCVNFDAESWCMYVGSGIMPDSDSEDEWDETSIKAKLLQSIIARFVSRD